MHFVKRLKSVRVMAQYKNDFRRRVRLANQKNFGEFISALRQVRSTAELERAVEVPHIVGSIFSRQLNAMNPGCHICA